MTKPRVVLGRVRTNTVTKKTGSQDIKDEKHKDLPLALVGGEYLGTASVGVSQSMSANYQSVKVDVHVSIPVALSQPYRSGLLEADERRMVDALHKATQIAADHMKLEIEELSEVL